MWIHVAVKYTAQTSAAQTDSVEGGGLSLKGSDMHSVPKVPISHTALWQKLHTHVCFTDLELMSKTHITKRKYK